jgi:mannose-6-phosphate isomerase-like protein (cupin superfamily)
VSVNDRDPVLIRTTPRPVLFLSLAALAVMAVVWASLGGAADRQPATAPASSDKPLAERVQHYDKVAVDSNAWGSLRWLMNSKLDPGAGITLGVAEIKPGQSNPLHVHGNCEEVIYMLSGTAEHRVGKETVTLKAGDVLRIPAGVPHSAKVLGNEPMRSIVVYNTGERQFTAVKE